LEGENASRPPGVLTTETPRAVQEERAMLQRDPGEDGNRGAGRYSLGCEMG